ncbi:hypothetical protein CERSUDRAFT_122132 [Gelatoporia subvermispora B]|uniref:Heterokaryon incompatibility domain-containing protein n=1 Tax=Ceriporiopsis subvermispora (strain B) TaxID=914234 RepID=M2RNL0_CERS8|nr:hypothetical protein CERSUDRAFT_122132 [Gelatoporia subvermispora B]
MATHTTIYDLPLAQLEGHIVDISQHATPCHHRLVDCVQFLEHSKLRIDEFHDFPHVEYSAISYVWRGRPDPGAHRRKTFTVAGAEAADPITIDVLRHACAASTQHNVRYIWLDRLCIIQTKKQDKPWQIREMFRIYQQCARCIVLPDGLCRLVSLSDETDWIHRGWTLQEAIAPRNVVVLFTWRLGAGILSTGGEYGLQATGHVTLVIPGSSAITDLSVVIDACAVGYFVFAMRTPEGLPSTFSQTRKLKSAILGICTPNVAAFATAMSNSFSEEARCHAIWRSALMRTSSRPVDMVFSIMGLFGISLDPRAFDESDRRGATVALARAILENGKSASWLGIAFRLPPAPQLSIFPVFPQTSVAGKALVRIGDDLLDVADWVDIEYPSPGPPSLKSQLPEGNMDDAGYLQFRGRCAYAAQISEDQAQQCSAQYISEDHDHTNPRVYPVTDANGTKWEISVHQTGSTGPLAFVVFLGWFDEYHPGVTRVPDKNIKLIIVKEHALERYHLHSFVSISSTLQDWVAAWPERDFCVGGPTSSNHNAIRTVKRSPERTSEVERIVESGRSHRRTYIETMWDNDLA